MECYQPAIYVSFHIQCNMTRSINRKTTTRHPKNLGLSQITADSWSRIKFQCIHFLFLRLQIIIRMQTHLENMFRLVFSIEFPAAGRDQT